MSQHDHSGLYVRMAGFWIKGRGRGCSWVYSNVCHWTLFAPHMAGTDTFRLVLTPAMVQIFKSRVYGEKHLRGTKMSYLAIISIKSSMADGWMHPSHTILYSKYGRCEMQQCCINIRFVTRIRMSSWGGCREIIDSQPCSWGANAFIWVTGCLKKLWKMHITTEVFHNKGYFSSKLLL